MRHRAGPGSLRRRHSRPRRPRSRGTRQPDLRWSSTPGGERSRRRVGALRVVHSPGAAAEHQGKGDGDAARRRAGGPMPSPRPSPTLAPGRHRGRPARVAVTATLLAACSPPRPSPPRPLSPGPAAGERDRRPQPATWPRSGPRRPGCGPPWTSSTGGWRSGAEDLEEAYAQGSSCWPTPPGWTAGAGRLSGSWPSPRPSCTSGPAAPTSPAPAGSCPAWWAPTIRPARPPPPPWSAPAASAPSSRPPAWQSTWQSASDDPAAGGATSDHHIRWLGHGR
jgi:hypothetical protein